MVISTKFKYKGDKKTHFINFIIIPVKVSELNVVLVFIIIDILIDSCCKTQTKPELHTETDSNVKLLLTSLSVKYTLTLKISLSISIYLVLYIYYHIPVIYIHCHYIIKIKNLVYKDLTLATKLNQTKEIFLSKLQIPYQSI